MKGKAYANRKPLEERPEADFYSTPYCLTWKLLEQNLFDKSRTIYEPASGSGAISSQLRKAGFTVVEDDIRTTRKDFLECTERYPYIITNPPFSLFDEFVLKAKEVSLGGFAMILKTNFFGAYNRSANGVWKHLKYVYIFDRQVDYRSPLRDDGLVHVGNLITGWGVWDMSWDEDYWQTKVVSVQEYCKLGGYKE